MASWAQEAAAATGAAVPQHASLPRHYVLPPPADAPMAPEQQVPLPETGLVDVILCSHRQALILLNHAVKVGATTYGRTVQAGAAASCPHSLPRMHSECATPLLSRRLQVCKCTRQERNAARPIPAGRGAGQHTHHGAAVRLPSGAHPPTCSGACRCA